MKFSNQRTFKSEIQNKKFLVKISFYPRVTNLMRAPKARANLIYSYKHKCTPKACLRGNQWSFYLQNPFQNLWPPNLKKSRSVFLFKLVFEIRFSDALFATEVIFRFLSQNRKWAEISHRICHD